jgi:cyclopropane-fatty-acyl-phospholipid synthase
MLPDVAEDYAASAAAIRAHYDVDNDFFATWLDPSLCYSAARWTGQADGLIAAQRRKLDWHLDAAHVGSGTRLLDVGCGWGALLFAASARGAREVTGLTLARKQVGWIRDRSEVPGVRVIQRGWQSATFDKPFDVVISVGALEHFARPELDWEEKTRACGAFFDFCRRSLTPKGRVSLQFIGWMNVEPKDERRHLPSMLFPQSNLPRVEEVIAAAAPGFHLLRLENRPQDYVRTLNAWLGRLRAHGAALEERHGREKLRSYVRGFQRFMLGFEAGSIGLYRAAWSVRSQAMS